MTNLTTPYPGLFRSENFAPRESFSISQIEKAFGSGTENLHTDASDGVLRVFDTGPGETDTGCLRSWGWRYLEGLKQPEYTWEEACALPEHTEDLRRLKGGAKSKTWGKVAETEIERYLKRDPSLAVRPIMPHIVAGLGLLPHPNDMVRYELQSPIKVRTHPDVLERCLNAPSREWSPESIGWVGFKDFCPTLAGPQRYLIDFKTTKPIVDRAKNLEAGRPGNAWAYMKDPSKLTLDWQYNLYEWDELVTHGALVPARWVYFASPGTEKYPNRPEARASDMPTPDLEIVRGVVRALDARARELVGHIRDFREKRITVNDLPANTLACPSYGGCPYHKKVGGPCEAEGDAIIPIGRLVAKQRTLTPRKTRRNEKEPAALGPSFAFTPDTSGAHDMALSIQEQINARLAAQQAQQQAPAPTQATPAPFQYTPPGVAAPVQAPPPVAPPAGAGAPGYPYSAAAQVGAPVPTAGLPPVFPAAAPAAPFNPQFAFGGAAPQAPAPVQAPPPVVQAPPPPVAAPVQVSSVSPRGTAGANPDYVTDGLGGWMPRAEYEAEQAHLAVPVAPSPTPGLPPEAFAQGGPAGPVAPPSPIQVATAPLPPAQVAEAPKKSRGRPKKNEPAPTTEELAAHAADNVPAPFADNGAAPIEAPGVYIRVVTTVGTFQVPAPADFSGQLQQYAENELGIRRG